MRDWMTYEEFKAFEVGLKHLSVDFCYTLFDILEKQSQRYATKSG